MHAPLRVFPMASSVEIKPPFSEGKIAGGRLAIWEGAGLTKLGELLPPDQKIPTIPTLAAHGYELHLVALQERGDENMMEGRYRLGNHKNSAGNISYA